MGVATVYTELGVALDLCAVRVSEFLADHFDVEKDRFEISKFHLHGVYVIGFAKSLNLAMVSLIYHNVLLFTFIYYTAFLTLS